MAACGWQRPLSFPALFLPEHWGRECFLRCGHDKFVLKDIPKEIYSSFNEHIRPRLRAHENLRLPSDIIPGKSIFVYKYLTDDFLSLVKQRLPKADRKKILKACLQGIAELHERDVVHLGKMKYS